MCRYCVCAGVLVGCGMWGCCDVGGRGGVRCSVMCHAM